MKLSEQDLDFVKRYEAAKYERPSATADTMLFRLKAIETKGKYPKQQLQVLLVKRKNSPYIGGWALPGGFCNMDETLVMCAKRELLEETGLTGQYFGQGLTYDSVDRDPRTRVLTTSFLAVIPLNETSEPMAGDDAAQALWFDVQLTTEHVEKGLCFTLSLSADECTTEGKLLVKKTENGDYIKSVVKDAEWLAFDHLEMITAGIVNLRNKIYYSDLPYYWLPKIFKFAELQRVFEAVMGRELLRSTLLNHLKHDLKRISDVDAADTPSEHEYVYQPEYLINELSLDIWR